MKYNININQLVLSKTSLDLIDSAILDYIIVICNSKSKAVSNKRKKDELGDWTWINFNKLIQDMPLLRIKSKSTISERIKKISKVGFLRTNQAKDKRLFVQLTEKTDSLFLEGVRENEQGVRENEQGVRENEQGVRENEQEVFVQTNIHNNTNTNYNTNYNNKDKELTDFLLSEVKKRYPFVKDKTEKQLISNYEEMNKLNRIDGYDYETISLVIRFSQYDEFWKRNIRSVDKLRRKFETLLIQAQSKIKEYQDNKIIKI